MATPDVEAQAQRSTNQLVFRNTLLLVGAKVLATPISVVSNAVIARYLGPADYSLIYLATTFTTFGLLFVVFGQTGALPQLVAVQRQRSGELLGTALAWRAVTGVIVYAVLALASLALGYSGSFQQALALVFVAMLVTFLAGACLETIRAFERTDIEAMLNVATPLLTAMITIPLVLLGGRLNSVLLVGVFIGTVTALVVSRFLKPVGVGKLVVSKSALKELLTKGYPFLFFSAAMVLQPTVDASFLSRLAPPEVVGWHAAAQKLVGLIVFPASALISALYPVLCRLYAEDRNSFADTTRSTLQTSLLLTVPLAAGCMLFPDVGVIIFGEEDYAPVTDNLRVFGIYVFLVYVSMPLGSAVLAAGRARAWSMVQCVCVVISLILDPILVPWFQARTGNGGLGICWAIVASEVFMVSIGLVMLPRGVLRKSMLRPLGGAIVGGAAMFLTQRVLPGVSSFIVGPLAVLAYGAALWLTGAMNREQIQFLKDARSRRRAR